MEDFFDDFDNDDFMDEDSFEDSVEGEMEDALTGDAELDDEHIEPESQDDDFTAKDAFILGATMGFAYEQGLRTRKRRKRKRFSNDSD